MSKSKGSELRKRVNMLWESGASQEVLWEAIMELAVDSTRLHFPAGDEDIAAQAVAKAFEGLPSFRGKCKLSSWVDRIVDHCCVDRLRERQQASKQVSLEALPAKDFGNLLSNPGRKIEPQEVNAGVRMAVGRLDPTQREIIRLHLDGVSMREIAAALGISRDVAIKRWQGALEALRDEAAEADY